MEGDLLDATVTHAEFVVQDGSDLVQLDIGCGFSLECVLDLLSLPNVPLLGKYVADAGTDLLLLGLLGCPFGGKLADAVLTQLLVPDKRCNKVGLDTVDLCYILLAVALFTVESDHTGELVRCKLLFMALLSSVVVVTSLIAEIEIFISAVVALLLTAAVEIWNGNGR